MDKIEKLRKVIKQEEIKNEKLFEKQAWCREHNFTIQADVLMKQYDAVRSVIRQIEMKVLDEIIDV